MQLGKYIFINYNYINAIKFCQKAKKKNVSDYNATTYGYPDY